jgi:predicted PurR-regulated permease PerM
MCAVGILTTVGLTVLGVPYALLLGVISAMLEIVPFVGPIVGGGLAVTAAFLDSPATAVWVLLLMVAIQQIESNLITPLVMAHAARVHPFVTLISLFLFGSLFGFLGVVLALPLVLLVWTAGEVFWVDRFVLVAVEEPGPVVGE